MENRKILKNYSEHVEANEYCNNKNMNILKKKIFFQYLGLQCDMQN